MMFTAADALLRGTLRTDDRPGAARLDTTDRRLPIDTADTSWIPAGIHLAFRSRDRRFVVHFESREAHPLSPLTRRESFTLWRGSDLVASEDAGSGSPVALELADDVSDGDEDSEYALYLPEALGVTVHGVESEGRLEPVEDRPVIFAYGDSIVQGWSTTDPGRAWTAQLGRMLGAEVCNLGFAGAARGEVAVAEQIAASDRTPTAIIIAFGTNAWTLPPTTAVAIAETLRIFLATVRGAWPDARVVVASPIVRPDAERRRNRLGATLADLRDALESAVSEYPDVVLIPGLTVMTAGELVDGIHPGDAGHGLVAAAVASAIGPLG